MVLLVPVLQVSICYNLELHSHAGFYTLIIIMLDITHLGYQVCPGVKLFRYLSAGKHKLQAVRFIPDKVFDFL